MRPAGEIREAVLQAARELWTPEKAPTILELAHRAKVSKLDARRTVDNMCRRSPPLLKVARERRVEYRNRPVAEYEPVRQPQLAAQPERDDGLDRALALWVRR